MAHDRGVSDRPPITLRKTVAEADPHELGAYLQQHTGLSRAAIKDALGKGALRLHKAEGKVFLRVRKADAKLETGDRMEFGYDKALLAIVPPKAELLEDFGAYSAWFKPAGLLAQGNEFGDHCSVLRQVEVWSRSTKRETYLVQRLDRETYGVMLFAHNRKAATELSRMINGGQARKLYRALVHGKVEARSGPEGVFDASLEGLSAVTQYRVLSFDPESYRSVVEVALTGGRLHQIRRHFAAASFPVVGDPRYGRGDGVPLKLAATKIAFHSNLLGRDVEVILPEERVGF